MPSDSVNALRGAAPWDSLSPGAGEIMRLPDFPGASESDRIGIFQQLIDGLSEQASLIDSDWTILAVNKAWKKSAGLNGLSDFRPGANYYDEVCKLADAHFPAARPLLKALTEIRQHKRTSFRIVYDGIGGQTGKRFEARVKVLTFGAREYLLVVRHDVTELEQLRHMRDGYSNSLRKTQEDERRRMGRELHDSGLQFVAGLSLALSRLKRLKSEEERALVIHEMEQLLVESRREFRSISYLAHPPQLENLPLTEAVSRLVDGFGGRAELQTRFAAEGPCDSAGHATEHMVYRVVQEALSNVHRHARAKTLVVRMVARRGILHVMVLDDGRGIPPGIRYGVGLESMGARLRELRGRLTIVHRTPGTAIIASVPLAKAARR